jgi:hypothetical protein
VERQVGALGGRPAGAQAAGRLRTVAGALGVAHRVGRLRTVAGGALGVAQRVGQVQRRLEEMGPCQMEADRGVRAALWLAAAQGLQAEPSLVAYRSPQAVLWPVAVRQVEAEETPPRAHAAERTGELQLALEQLLHKNDQNETLSNRTVRIARRPGSPLPAAIRLASFAAISDCKSPGIGTWQMHRAFRRKERLQWHECNWVSSLRTCGLAGAVLRSPSIERQPACIGAAPVLFTPGQSRVFVGCVQ